VGEHLGELRAGDGVLAALVISKSDATPPSADVSVVGVMSAATSGSTKVLRAASRASSSRRMRAKSTPARVRRPST
jgi:hypothetical protein